MEIIYRTRALNSLAKVVAFVEGQNTEGSGERWLDKIHEVIISLSETAYGFQICRHASLAKFKYCCYEHKGWVIAFRITEKKFEMCRLIWAARLS